MFILTGDRPLRSSQSEGSIQRSATYPRLVRIDLSVDASLSPARVVAAYRKLRREAWGANRRVRKMSLVTGELAVFATSCRGYDETWNEVREHWNRVFPAAAYSDTKKFSRDARAAYRRVTGKQLRRSEHTA